MAGEDLLLPSASFRDALALRGGESVSRCFQCATCSAVCDLSGGDTPFPRRQMLLSQWGLREEVVADPAVWLCHQCNDCTERCPRDARPGDVLHAVRSLVIDALAFPRAFGRLFSGGAVARRLLLVVPVLFWLALLGATGHLATPRPLRTFEQAVPHGLIYAVFFPAAAWVVLASAVSGRRFWSLLQARSPRRGPFLRHLAAVLPEIAGHGRFRKCTAARPRSAGHLLLFWGFLGAAFTSGLLVLALYVQKLPMPLALGHPYKVLGNVSALLLVAGAVLLVSGRLRGTAVSGTSSPFDTHFLLVVCLVIATGVAAETARLVLAPDVAFAVYVMHLGIVLSLFLSFPYSKFAHVLYRTLAMVHERMR